MIRILNELDIEYKFQVSWRKRYILDFWLPKYGLNIECDGATYHLDKAKDEARDKWLWENSKMRVLRFPTYTFKDWNKIVDRICSKCPGVNKRTDPLSEEFAKVVS